MRRSLLIAVSLVFAVLLASSIAQAQPSGPVSSDISFMVSMSKPWTHLLEVEMRVKVAANLNVPNETDLVVEVGRRHQDLYVTTLPFSDPDVQNLSWIFTYGRLDGWSDRLIS